MTLLTGEELKQPPDITLAYDGGVWGHNLAATSLAGDIERGLALPVALHPNGDAVFEVRVNGAALYRHQGEMHLFHARQEIIQRIQAHLNLACQPAPASPPARREDDPDHREWMGCVCSGE